MVVFSYLSGQTIKTQMTSYGWTVEEQFTYQVTPFGWRPFTNVIGKDTDTLVREVSGMFSKSLNEATIRLQEILTWSSRTRNIYTIPSGGGYNDIMIMSRK